MKHIRLFTNVFGSKYCIVGRDVPDSIVQELVPALMLLTQHFPELSVEVTDPAVVAPKP